MTNILTAPAGFTPIDQMIANWFNSLWGGNGWGNLLLILLSLLAAVLFAGILGYEREYHGHAAGLRTHILVATGSAIVMVISIYGFSFSAYENRDPARLAAQVVTGIGFLGAGTIIQTGTDVKGLTTATTLWLAMAIGLAAGSGNFTIAAIGTILSVSVLTIMRHVEKFANRKNPNILIVVPSNKPVLKDILELANRYGINIRAIETQLIEKDGQSLLRITMRCIPSSKASVSVFVEDIRTQIHPFELKVQTHL